MQRQIAGRTAGKGCMPTPHPAPAPLKQAVGKVAALLIKAAFLLVEGRSLVAPAQVLLAESPNRFLLSLALRH
jgi:hypothetical protein